MSESQQKQFVTPLGKLAYPRLTTPDTRFLAAGVYSVRLILDPQTAAPLVSHIDGEILESVAQAKKDNPRLKRIKVADKPYKRVLNNDDNETDEIAFTFKMTASGITNQTKPPSHRRPAIFDAKCNSLT